MALALSRVVTHFDSSLFKPVRSQQKGPQSTQAAKEK
jgi:hypothetical protein